MAVGGFKISDIRRDKKWFEGFQLVELAPEHPKFSYVKDKVDGAFTIKKLYKIKNSTIWNNYEQVREFLYWENGGKKKVWERHLFHGSPFAKIIAKDGFKESPGRGTFFSPKASYSDAYAKKNGGSEFTMLLCKVALGIKGTHSNHAGDEISIGNEKQAYPSFLIEY